MLPFTCLRRKSRFPPPRLLVFESAGWFWTFARFPPFSDSLLPHSQHPLSDATEAIAVHSKMAPKDTLLIQIRQSLPRFPLAEIGEGSATLIGRWKCTLEWCRGPRGAQQRQTFNSLAPLNGIFFPLKTKTKTKTQNEMPTSSLRVESICYSSQNAQVRNKKIHLHVWKLSEVL